MNKMLLALAAVCALALPAQAKAAGKPTIVLVHGAFADASSWAPEVQQLQAKGYTVVAPANPLRGVASDSAYLKSVMAQISGPIVLAGHSYGGMVITNAATGNANVKALVYVAAYAPDQGDSVASLAAKVPGGMVGPATLDIRSFPNPDGTTGQEGYIKPSVFHTIFDADLPLKQSKLLAASQRPASLSALGEPSGPPAWKTIPSYFEVAGKDLAVGTKLEQFEAKRMKAKETVVIKGASHLVMLSHPDETTQLILDAAKAKIAPGRGPSACA